MKRKIVLFVLFVVLALPYAMFAGELVLIKGKGVPVCEAHYKNLKQLNIWSTWFVIEINIILRKTV